MPRKLAKIIAVAGALAGALPAAGLVLPALIPALIPASAAAQATAALPMPPPRLAVVDARLGIHPDKTRFVLELSEAVAFTVSVRNDPHRVIVDLPELAWPGGGAPAAGKGLVTRYRYGPSDSGASQLVFETAGPVKVREAFMIPARDGHQPRFVLDLERATPAEAARPAAPAGPGATAGPAPKPATATAAAVRPAASPVPLPRPQPPDPDIIPAAAPVAPPPIPPAAPKAAGRPEKSLADKPVIAIDPGHGGVDPGAVGVGNVYEKDITLAMAREMKRQLEASGRYRVQLTRDKDVFVRLRDRVALAREAGADLFVSLHADSIGTNSMRGLSIYTLSDKASDREAEMLAAKENRADAIAGLDLSAENDQVASILIDLAQRDTMNQSKRFANVALEQLGREVKLIPSRPHRQAGFAVLTAPDVPSVLVEMGYLSSPQDANLLTTPGHREKLGRALTKGIDAYFKWLAQARRS